MQLPIVIDALGTVTPLATITLKPQVGGVLTEVLYTEGQIGHARASCWPASTRGPTSRR